MRPSRRTTKAKPKLNKREIVFELNNKLEDFKLTGQDTLVYLHWTPEQWLDTDFYDLMELQTAKKPKDREQDPMKMLQSLGLM